MGSLFEKKKTFGNCVICKRTIYYIDPTGMNTDKCANCSKNK